MQVWGEKNVASDVEASREQDAVEDAKVFAIHPMLRPTASGERIVGTTKFC